MFAPDKFGFSRVSRNWWSDNCIHVRKCSCAKWLVLLVHHFGVSCFCTTSKKMKQIGLHIDIAFLFASAVRIVCRIATSAASQQVPESRPTRCSHVAYGEKTGEKRVLRVASHYDNASGQSRHTYSVQTIQTVLFIQHALGSHQKILHSISLICMLSAYRSTMLMICVLHVIWSDDL